SRSAGGSVGTAADGSARPSEEADPDRRVRRCQHGPMADAAELVVPLSGADWWRVPPSGDVPAMKVTDGPSGARGERFAGGPPSVSFPCGAALGATWDVDLLERVGRALAEETRAK